MQNNSTSLLVRDEYALVPSNPRVVVMARRFGWSVGRSIERIKSALPALIEQQIYLAIVGDFGILPESMAKLLRLYLGAQELCLDDLSPKMIGENLHSSKFLSFAEYLRECLNLLKVVNKEYSDFSITIEHAGLIVLHYGTDNPELLIEMVDTNLEEMCCILGIGNTRSYGWRMRTCVWLMAKVIIPQNRKNGCPDILDVSDFFAIAAAKRNEIRRLFHQELPDYLAFDRDEMRGCGPLELLKREGVI